MELGTIFLQHEPHCLSLDTYTCDFCKEYKRLLVDAIVEVSKHRGDYVTTAKQWNDGHTAFAAGHWAAASLRSASEHRDRRTINTA